ncbi:MAG TPA: Gfo/Idh/MocA family oxidoreductase [Pirellulales bacterium]|nr:Gfo/Idh/MocA family oxidoreductase [Pirellulales bacterium]
MSRSSRRHFLKTSLAAAGAAGVATFAGTQASAKARGANDAIRVGIAGLNGRGGEHLKQFASLPGVEITYLIDPDQKVLERRVKEVESLTGRKPQAIQDVRKALDDKELDVITVATPNHWHSLIAIWACQAGKDVYVEKPCSHNVHEGRIAVETARKYNRIVQHGTQSRSDSDWAGAVDFVRSGKAGKLQVARGLVYKPRPSIGFKKAEAPPDYLDFNLWLGPATEQPFHRNLVHYNWHWFWDTGNGDIGNQGVHQMDIARWGIDGATFPKSVIGLGGRFGYEDQGQTANTQIAVFDYGDAQLIFEVRGLPTENFAHTGHGSDNVFHCEGGLVTRKQFYPKGSAQPEPIPSAPIGPGKNHFANFISAVRSRNQSELNADILEGHYSSALCHLANISYRLGEKVPFNPQTKAFGDNKEAYETLARMEQHLTRNGLKLDEIDYLLGRKLAFDSQKELFVGDEQANRMLTRDYRAPFVVPEKVA